MTGALPHPPQSKVVEKPHNLPGLGENVSSWTNLEVEHDFVVRLETAKSDNKSDKKISLCDLLKILPKARSPLRCAHA
jgi:hypothetical protein